MWWIDLLRGFLSLCGAAVSLFVLVHTWRAVRDMRRDNHWGPREKWSLATVAVLLPLYGVVLVVTHRHWASTMEERHAWRLSVATGFAGAFVISGTSALVGLLVDRRRSSTDVDPPPD